VSHLKERKEKICLNCNAELQGRYCHHCGQENLEPKETVWHLVTHFFNDITHFDGKFFETVRLLLRKPGFLSLQYMAGKRATYLNPIRMYVFTSAIFFIILFSLRGTKGILEDREDKEGLVELQQRKAKLETRLTRADGDDKTDLQRRLSKVGLQIAAVRHVYGDSTQRKFDDEELGLAVVQEIKDSLQHYDLPKDVRERLNKQVTEEKEEDNFSFFGLNPGHYKSVEEYNAAQARLPEDFRDGWLTRVTMRKMIHLTIAYHDDKKGFKEHLKENILHSFPKILFVTLPIFALILNILYFRHKQYYYVNHGIFTIHVYCATFILLLLYILIEKLSDAVDMRWFTILCMLIMIGIWFYILIYLYKAMRGFYKQGRFKTFLKYFITCSLAFIINTIVFVLFILISVVSVG
jgi:ribosomal protein L40E